MAGAAICWLATYPCANDALAQYGAPDFSGNEYLPACQDFIALKPTFLSGRCLGLIEGL